MDAPEYEYVPRPWYRVTHACAHTNAYVHTHTHIQVLEKLVLYCTPCTNAPLYSTYTCGEHAYIRDIPLTFHPAAVSFGDDAAVLCKWMQNDSDRRGDG